jgi:hypothetical protein
MIPYKNVRFYGRSIARGTCNAPAIAPLVARMPSATDQNTLFYGDNLDILRDYVVIDEPQELGSAG